MGKKRWVIFLIVFFLLQFTILFEVLSAADFSLTQIENELQYQPKVKFFYEVKRDNPAAILWTLPSLNDILSGCRIEPFQTYSTVQVDKSL